MAMRLLITRLLVRPIAVLAEKRPHPDPQMTASEKTKSKQRALTTNQCCLPLNARSSAAASGLQRPSQRLRRRKENARRSRVGELKLDPRKLQLRVGAELSKLSVMRERLHEVENILRPKKILMGHLDPRSRPRHARSVRPPNDQHEKF